MVWSVNAVSVQCECETCSVYTVHWFCMIWMQFLLDWWVTCEQDANTVSVSCVHSECMLESHNIVCVQWVDFVSCLCSAYTFVCLMEYNLVCVCTLCTCSSCWWICCSWRRRLKHRSRLLKRSRFASPPRSRPTHTQSGRSAIIKDNCRNSLSSEMKGTRWMQGNFANCCRSHASNLILKLQLWGRLSEWPARHGEIYHNDYDLVIHTLPHDTPGKDMD